MKFLSKNITSKVINIVLITAIKKYFIEKKNNSFEAKDVI